MFHDALVPFAERRIIIMDKKNTRLWCLSLLIISIVRVIWAVCNIAGIELPDVAVRIMGVLDICAVPVLAYTSIRHMKQKG